MRQGWDVATEEFLDAYFKQAAGSERHPVDMKTADLLLQLFVIQKAVYEVGYELASRPAWVGIPLRGLLELAGD